VSKGAPLLALLGFLLLPLIWSVPEALVTAGAASWVCATVSAGGAWRREGMLVCPVPTL